MKALAIYIEDIEKRIIFTIERCQSDEPVSRMLPVFITQVWRQNSKVSCGTYIFRNMDYIRSH